MPLVQTGGRGVGWSGGRDERRGWPCRGR